MLDDITIADNIYIITGYTDMRKSIDGLCAIVMDQMKAEPDSHAIYLFCGKRCDRIKVRYHSIASTFSVYHIFEIMTSIYLSLESGEPLDPSHHIS